MIKLTTSVGEFWKNKQTNKQKQWLLHTRKFHQASVYQNKDCVTSQTSKLKSSAENQMFNLTMFMRFYLFEIIMYFEWNSCSKNRPVWIILIGEFCYKKGNIFLGVCSKDIIQVCDFSFFFFFPSSSFSGGGTFDIFIVKIHMKMM